ncbi:MAG: aminotransferase class V-fold PLP-dependent enzyme [Planctomycetota bacterium]
MDQRIDEHPSERDTFEPTFEEMRQAGYALIDKMVGHYESLSDQMVAQKNDQHYFAKLFDEPVPCNASEVGDCTDFFFSKIVPLMTHVDHPRFHAYIPCPSSFAGGLGMMLAAATNPFVGSWLGGASLASLELTVLRWIREMLWLPSEFEGVFTSGGSIANLIGLASAREKYGFDTLNRGRIYVSDQVHGSVEKAAKALGFLESAVVRIDTNRRGEIEVHSLTQQIRSDRNNGFTPFFATGNAGTTNSGAIDPLDQLAELCQEENIWFHVDGAYGGFAAMLPEIRRKLNGLERADSITLDPHKWLYCPMGIGCALVRSRHWMEAAFSTHGEYLKDLDFDEVNFFNRGPELSRPARALPVWMVLRTYGRDAIAGQIQSDIDLAHFAADQLRQDPRFEVDEVQLSIVAFRHRLLPGETEELRTERDNQLMESTLKSGQLMLSSTILNGKNTLRLVVMNHRTTRAEVLLSVEWIRKLANSTTD